MIELEKKAKAYRESKKDLQYFSEPYKEKIERAYIDGAKENGVVLHDLKKNPNDLPLKMGIGSEVVLISYGGKVTDFAYYNFKLKRWEHDEDDFYICDPPPIAWCEIPEFEEE